MHGPLFGERRVEHVFEAAQDVVGVEHRILGDLLQAVGAVAEDVGQRAGEHAHLAVEGDHSAEGVGMLLAGILFLDQLEAAVGIFGDERQRAEGRERFRQHDRARTRAAAAVRGREGLVEVDVHRVDAEVARANLADDRVEIGAVAIDEGARQHGPRR